MLITVLLLAAAALATPQERQNAAAYIRARNIGMCIGAASTASGTPLTLRNCSLPNTRWKFNQWDGCDFKPTTLQLDGTNLCVTVGYEYRGGAIRRNGDALVLTTDCPTTQPGYCNVGTNTRGTTFALNHDYFGFGLRSGLDYCVDNDGGRGTEGNKIQVWDCHQQSEPGYYNQQWEFTQQ